MSLTPLDLHNKEFRKSFRGYDEVEVDEFLDMVVKEYEKIYKENIELKEALAAKDSDIGQYQDLEDTLKKTLVIAQKTSEDLKANAVKEAELIINEARAKSEKIVADAEAKAKAILKEYEDVQKQAMEFKTRIKALLRSQLEMLDGEKIEESLIAAGKQEDA